MAKYFLLSATLGFTVYAQLMLKWQVMQTSHMPTDWIPKIQWGFCFILRPWMLTCFAAGFLAFVCWSLVLRQMPLSRAYPFMGLSFILVAWLSSVFFGETLSFTKLFGTVLVVVGLVFASQG